MRGRFESKPDGNEEEKKNTNAVLSNSNREDTNNLTKRENVSLPQKRDKKKDESVTSSNLLFPV